MGTDVLGKGWCVAFLALTLTVHQSYSLPANVKKANLKAEVHIHDFKSEDKVFYEEPTTLLDEEELFEFNKEKIPPTKDNNIQPTFIGQKSSSKHHGKHNKAGKSRGHKNSFHVGDAIVQTCAPISIPMCRHLDLYPLAQYPNHLGHRSELDAVKALEPYMPLMKDQSCAGVLREFLCLLHAPQCSGTNEPLLPCRMGCTAARKGCSAVMKVAGLSWPAEWACDQFSLEGLCVESYTKASPVPEPRHTDLIQEIVHKELKSYPSEHENLVEHTQPMAANQLKPRNYKIRQLGQSELFQGWADVQGQGAANDYCRVIGNNPNLRFLSCTLGGSTMTDHVFVSKRGFDVGHRNTWYMRDVDGDGRDDYCRCVGKGLKSHISCMKAGEFGFHGSPQQPGSEYTFPVKTGGPCFQKTLNPFIGV